MFGGGAIHFAGAKDGAGELGLVRRVGIVLGFEAEGVVLLEAARARAAVEKIAAVELYARLGRIDLHHASTRRLLHAGGELQLALLAAEDEAMVVALRLVWVFFQLAN